MKCFTFMLLCCSLAVAQKKINSHKKITSHTLNDTILYPAIDRTGDFYVVTKSAQIQKFDPFGKLILLYKASKVPTIFDPRDGARLFAYFREDQHYEYLTPSFKPIGSYQIDSAFAIQPWLMCPSGEYKLWVLDSMDNSLKKINVKASEVEVEVMVDSTLIKSATSFKTMREYQGFVFLLDPDKGIFIFNSLGKHLKTIDVSGIHHFNFLGEELYYLRDDYIQLFNLFTAETRSLKTGNGYIAGILTEERMMLFLPQTIDIFDFRP